jgi:hypothetical protein
MERGKNLELHLTEAELETLVPGVQSDGRFADLNLSCAQPGEVRFRNLIYRSAIPDVG